MTKQLFPDPPAEQLPTWSGGKPLSRSTDKATSHEAAAEIEAKLTLVQGIALRAATVLCGRPPRNATANEIAWEGGVKHGRLRAADEASAETIRKRVHELERLGLLVECGQRACSVTGKKATTYRVKE